MRITHLEVRGVRILCETVLEPAPALNLILGPNGSGKTALLEAIHLLTKGRSFRTPRVSEVIRHNQSSLQVCAHIDHQMDGQVTVGVERGTAPLLMRYRGESVRRMSEYAAKLPVVVIAPDNQNLVLGAPKERRHWLDWAMFHVEPTYLDCWRAYMRALRHRNALLQSRGASAELSVFEESMDHSATELHRARKRFMQELESEFAASTGDLGEVWPRIELNSGWGAEEGLGERLSQDRQGDRETGFTRAGPHVADIEFRCGSRHARAVFSRGECKLFVSLMLICQAAVIARRTGENPVLLADDFGAELDVDARAKLQEVRAAHVFQSFLTSSRRDWDGPAEGTAVFHVEHGHVRKLVE